VTEAGAPVRIRVADGEEARLTPGTAADAEVWSRGFLPLRPRSEGSYRLRPAFPGTAVVLGRATFEVMSETELPDHGLFVYRLRAWPEGEVVRDRVVYGAAFVRAVQLERERQERRERVRPYRFVLYPLIGLLPEEEQVWLSERYGLYAVTATLVSGLLEAFGLLLVPTLLTRSGVLSPGHAISAAGLLSLLALPALGRAFSAFFLRETGGSAPVVAVYESLRALGVRFARHDLTVVPLTRAAFWERLARPDSVSAQPDGSYVFVGLLPHLSWDGKRALAAGDGYWKATPEPPELVRGRLVHVYTVAAMADPPAPGEPAPPAPDPPASTAYADEVMEGVRREWDDLNHGFAWFTSLLGEELQGRAFDHRGGPAAARRATLWTAGAGATAAIYLLSFLPGPAGDPVAPLVALVAVLLLVDGARRFLASRAGRYAPSLFRFALPTDILRPERVAYHAHRDAERRILDSRPLPPRS
jgi:hypothetical protein